MSQHIVLTTKPSNYLTQIVASNAHATISSIKPPANPSRKGLYSTKRTHSETRINIVV
jgi:hypothetical protein